MNGDWNAETGETPHSPSFLLRSKTLKEKTSAGVFALESFSKSWAHVMLNVCFDLFQLHTMSRNVFYRKYMIEKWKQMFPLYFCITPCRASRTLKSVWLHTCTIREFGRYSPQTAGNCHVLMLIKTKHQVNWGLGRFIGIPFCALKTRKAIADWAGSRFHASFQDEVSFLWPFFTEG